MNHFTFVRKTFVENERVPVLATAERIIRFSTRKARLYRADSKCRMQREEEKEMMKKPVVQDMRLP